MNSSHRMAKHFNKAALILCFTYMFKFLYMRDMPIRSHTSCDSWWLPHVSPKSHKMISIKFLCLHDSLCKGMKCTDMFSGATTALLLGTGVQGHVQCCVQLKLIFSLLFDHSHPLYYLHAAFSLISQLSLMPRCMKNYFVNYLIFVFEIESF